MSSPAIKGSLPLGGVYDSLPQGSLALSGPRELMVRRSIGAAFALDGKVVTETMRAMLESAFTGALPKRTAVEDVVRVDDRAVLWGGNVMTHYGHFLTESVGRLWPLLPGGELEGLPVVFTTPREVGFVREWLQAFGVETVELPEQGAVRFTRMLIPQPALRHGAWIAPELRDIHLRARRGLDLPAVPRRDVAWLSRVGLERGHVAYDECLLEWLLGGYVEPIRLETMPLAEQVAALEACRGVAGVAGSAFHTLLMVEDLPDCLYLCGSWDKGVYPAQHRYMDTEATFVQGLAVAARRLRAREGVSFPGAYRLLIPETLRALSETLLPALLDDPRIARFADPANAGPSAETGLDSAVERVLVDPHSVDARAELAGLFEAEGLAECAREQRFAAEDLSEE